MEYNITLTEDDQPISETEPVTEQLPETEPKKEVRFVDIEINDDNTALNLMVAFLNMAQRRGAFGMDESAKIWECVKRFIKPE